MATEAVTEIEHLQQIIESLQQENLELMKHNQLLQEENSKLTELLEQVDDDIEGPVDEEADCEENSKWLPLKGFDDYVIKNYYPYDIKRISTGCIVKEYDHGDGYICASLLLGNKQKNCRKHVLVARQFILNDDPKHKTMVDHINKHRDDNHTTNLRWVTPSDNTKNKSSHRGIEYEYVKEIPDDAIVVDSYGKYKFEDYYFHDDKFYFYNGIEYRILHICTNKNGCKYVCAMNTEGQKTSIWYSKFKRIYNLE
ncbi:hypothetical protein M9Y10_041691 [Tritrichomonas musculus]|uniref:HNH nuclease domain-containing protein n=2 Tax=Tritrichomonas musculus TaxID=1915356 RepID=A0ABR2K6V2_9EUKA